MTVLRVVGEAECTSVSVESDRFLPLKISWWPRGQIQPLYLRVTGASGGEVEFKVDPGSGALLQVIVIVEPPKPEQDQVQSFVPRDGVADKTPRLDLSLWAPSPEHRTGADQRPVFTVAQFLTLSTDGGKAVLRVSEQQAVDWIRCDGVAVGVSAERTLVTVEAELTS